MDSSLQRIYQLLGQLAYDNVNSAEASLNQQAKSNPLLLSNLHSIIRHQPNEDWIKMLAASYINTTYCDLVFCLDLNEQNKMLVDILSDFEVSPIHKRVLERAVVQMIDNLEQPYLTELREKIFIFLSTDQLRDVGYFLIGCFSIPLIDVNHPMYLLRLFLQFGMDRMILFENSQTSVYMTAEYNQILKTWVLLWDAILPCAIKDPSKQKEYDLQVSKEREYSLEAANLLIDIANSDKLCQIIMKVYEWMGNDNIYFCGIEGLAELNFLKYSASQVHWRLLKYSLYNGITTSSCCNFTTLIMEKVMKNMFLYSSQRNNLQSHQCKDLGINFLKIMQFYVELNPTYFSNCWKELIQYCVLPLLVMTEDQMVQFEQQKEDFCTLFEDCSESQKFGIIKTEAAKLLQTISEKNNKITQTQRIETFAIRYALDSIISALGGNVSRIQYYSNIGLNFTTFECAIQILAVYSYILKQYSKELNQTFSMFNKDIIMKLSPIDRSRLYSFLGYNYGEAFPNKEQGGYIVELALMNNNHPTTNYAAIDFILNIADQYYSDFFMDKLSEKVIDNDSVILWEAISKLIQSQYQKISYMLLIKLISNINTKILKQLGRIKGMEIKQTQSIAKLIQIIQTIVGPTILNHFQLQQDHGNQLKQAVFHVMNNLPAFTSIDMSEEALRIIYSLLLKEQSMSYEHPLNTLIPEILSIFQKDEYSDLIFYRILNCYLMKNSYGPIIVQIVTLLYNIMMKYLLSKNIKHSKTKYRLIFGNTFCLLQNAFGLFGPQLPKELVQSISCIPYRFIPESVNNQQVQGNNKVLTSKAFNLLILCHFCLPNENLWRQVHTFIGHQIFYGYDLKVFLACVKKEINQINDLYVSANLLLMAMTAVELYENRKQIEKKIQKIRQEKGKGSKVNTRIKIIRDAEYTKLTKTISNPFGIQNKKAPKSELILMIEELKNKNKEAFNLIINKHFNDDDKKRLQRICGVSISEKPERRIIYSISPKLSGSEMVESSEREMRQFINDKEIYQDDECFQKIEDEESQDAIDHFKRRRVETKKADKKKKKNT